MKSVEVLICFIVKLLLNELIWQEFKDTITIIDICWAQISINDIGFAQIGKSIHYAFNKLLNIFKGK